MSQLKEFADVLRKSDTRSSEKHENEHIPVQERRLVRDFLKKFELASDLSAHNYIDLRSMLKMLPLRFHDDNVAKADLTNFRNIQLALISFQNEA